MSLNCIDDPLDRGRLLTDRDVDADDVTCLLIDDAIDGNCRLTDGAVPDDQLSLAAPQGKHGIEDEQAGLDRFAVTKSRSMIAGAGRSTGFVAFGIDCSTTVNWAAQRIDGATEQGWPYRDAYHLAGAADPVPCLNSFGLVEENASKRIAI